MVKLLNQTANVELDPSITGSSHREHRPIIVPVTSIVPQSGWSSFNWTTFPIWANLMAQVQAAGYKKFLWAWPKVRGVT